MIPPGDPFLNDVTAFSDGGFAATQMWDKDSIFPFVALRLLFEMDTGWVWEWSPKSGFRKVPDSEGAMPNGITSSPDDRFLFVNHYAEDRMVKIDRASGEVVGEVEVRQPDNVTLDEAGNLWIASHHNFIADTTCQEIEGACPLPFSIVRVNAQSLEAEVVLEHEGAPMGFATVALPTGQRLFLGSAAGDRMVSIPLPAGPGSD